ncbi:MAG: purine-nucleoside phosphorylase [Deltaproteobacteria bacterium]|nr:purine-nucleoside phosphorylase [Deltaproteobacteria bacterium]MBW2661059.1 purine-nucleoside phosphorylase [Deltaproteobacteria bacterium]
MKSYKQKAVQTAEFLKTKISNLPEIGIIAGTGHAESAASMELSVSFEYKDIPHFPVSTVQSHFGRLLLGSMQGRQVIAMQGRLHLYEGYTPAEVTFPVRVMQELGLKYLILSNASGGLNPDFKAGDIMIISDHINLTGSNPLAGPNEESWGIRFPDMTRAYDINLASIAEKAGKNAGIPLQKGVYAGLKGPCLETPAETRFLKTIGAEAVGFSTVHEVITAVHARMKVLGLSTITNVNDPDNPVESTMEEIIAVAKKSSLKLASIINNVIKDLT